MGSFLFLHKSWFLVWFVPVYFTARNSLTFDFIIWILIKWETPSGPRERGLKATFIFNSWSFNLFLRFQNCINPGIWKLKASNQCKEDSFFKHKWDGSSNKFLLWFKTHIKATNLLSWQLFLLNNKGTWSTLNRVLQLGESLLHNVLH